MNKRDGIIKEFFLGSSLIFLWGIVGFIFLFFFKLFAARHYNPTQYGTFILIETIISFLLIFITIGIPQGIRRYIPYYEHSNKLGLLNGYLDFIFKIPTTFAIITSILLFLSADTLSNFFNLTNGSIYFKLISIILPFKIFSNIFRKIFISKRLYFHPTFNYNFIENIVLIIGIILIQTLNLGVIWIIITLVTSILISFIYDLIIYYTKVTFKKSDKEYKLKEWINYSLPLFLTGVFAYFINWSDNLIISKILNPSELGIYSIAFSLAIVLLFVKTSFTSIFLPLISKSYAKKDKKNIKLLFEKSSEWILLLTLPAFLFLIFNSKGIITILYGPEYSKGYIPLIIISFGAIISATTGMNSEILELYKKTKTIFKLNVLIATFNLILNMVLIPFIGIVGAAISTSLSISSQNIALLLKAKKLEKINFNIKKTFKILFCGIAAILTVEFIKGYLLIDNPIKLSLLAIFYLMIYLITIILFKVFTKEDLQF